MLLPPNAYRADERSVLAHYAEVAKAGVPIVAYNNPIDTKVDLVPELLAKLHGEGTSTAVKEFSGDVRRAYQIAELAPELDLLIGADDVLLELALAGAKGWVAGYPNALPAATRRAVPRGRRRRPRHRAAALPAAAPAAALGLQGRVRAGHQAVDGHRRPARRPGAARRGSRCCRSRRPRSARPPRRPSRRVSRSRRPCNRHGARSCAANSSCTPSTRTPRACPPG